MGPLGGDRGGRLVAAGTPEAVAEIEQSLTGQYLRPVLEQVRARRHHFNGAHGSNGAEPSRNGLANVPAAAAFGSA